MTEAGRPDPVAAVTRLLTTEGHRPLVDELMRAVVREHAAYEHLRDQAGFRAAVSAVSRLYCATVADDRGVSAKEAIALQVIGAQRARQGITEDQLVGSVRTAMRAGWAQFTAAVADHCESPQQLQSITAALFGRTDCFVDEVVRALCLGHRAETEQALPGQARAQAGVVDRLLEPGWSDEELFAFAREHGVPVVAPLALLVVTAPPGLDLGVMRDVVAYVAAQVDGILDGPLRVQGVPHLISLVNDAVPERLPALRTAAEEAGRRHGAVATVLTPVGRPSSLAEAYDACVALLCFAALARPRGGGVALDELRLYELLASMPVAARTDFCLGILGRVAKLPASKRADLFDTFETWLWAGSTKAAATWLRGVSEGTVRYRLRRLEEFTGYRLGVPAEGLLVQLAVRIFRAWVEPLQRAEPDRPSGGRR